ncbi:heparin lyase I family protein [Qipengyuania sp. CAU 1752]
MRMRPVRKLCVVSAILLSTGCVPAGEESADKINEPPRLDRSGFRAIGIAALPEAEAFWSGRIWRANAGSVQHGDLAYAVQTDPSGEVIRFELRNSDRDRSPNDAPSVRRAELSGSLYGDKQRLVNATPLWGAFSFRHHAWTDPDAMRRHTGGVYGQIHMGSQFGGSPALAFRRTSDGLFRITTRGQHDTGGTVRYEAPLSFDESHDLTYRIVIHPYRGSLAVWLDGKQVIDSENISIGHESAQSYWNLGLYFSGGIDGRVIAEYANHRYPSPVSLAQRAVRPEHWPR